jgi:Recombinase
MGGRACELHPRTCRFRWQRLTTCAPATPNVLPIIREAQKAGARTLREIAEALNARGIPTARGGQWYAQSVANILERA